MPKFEGAPHIDSPEINSSEVPASGNVGKKLEREFTPEELGKLRAEGGQEQVTEEPELSPEDQLKSLEGEAEATQQEITRLTELVEGTKAQLNEAREKLGLPSTKEDPPSVFSEKDKLEKLKFEQEGLEKRKKELISKQEKERLIREEKEKILQEKLDEIFKEFEGLNSRDFESIFKSGKTPEGRNVESKSMGSLDPGVAQSLARAFKEGVRLLPKLLEALPELLKEFDEDLTKEATERVDKKLEEEKPEEPNQQEEKPKVLEGEISHGEVSPIEGENIEIPRA